MSTAHAEPFFTTLAPGRFAASSHCGGPWDARLQHGSPPEALIARELRRVAGREGATIARLTFELLGPIPVGEVTIEVEVARPGQRVQMLEAVMHAAGRPVIRARAWQVAHGGDEVSATGLDLVPPERPAEESVPPVPWNASPYVNAIEWRFTGGDFTQRGPGSAWTRPRRRLVDDEPLTGWDRAMLVADSANGISITLDLTAWYSIPPETTIHLLREPLGEWVHLDAVTQIAEGGPGVCRGALSDAHGPVGYVTQSLLVSQR